MIQSDRYAGDQQDFHHGSDHDCHGPSDVLLRFAVANESDLVALINMDQSVIFMILYGSHNV